MPFLTEETVIAFTEMNRLEGLFNQGWIQVINATSKFSFGFRAKTSLGVL
jgi:hypothetical protein